mgnify:CR=1 FL=1
MTRLSQPLTKRQGELLTVIIEEYTRSCTPVGSKMLADKTGHQVSPATIRNDLVALEAAGMLTHPHTSAGRVPTHVGYQWYVDRQPMAYHLSKRDCLTLRTLFAPSQRDQVKFLAKRLSELSDACALVGFSASDVYYTGLSNLLAQPEFRNYDFSYSISLVIDHLDETLQEIFSRVSPYAEVQIFLGQRNPFAGDCSAMLVGFRSFERGRGLLGLLGPVRMDYPRNRALLEYAQQVISTALPSDAPVGAN